MKYTVFTFHVFMCVLISCNKEPLAVISHQEPEAPLEVSFAADTISIADSIYLRAITDGPADTIRLDHIFIDGKRIAYSIPFPLSGKGQEDTLAIAHGRKNAGRYTLEFHACREETSKRTEVPVCIYPDSTSFIYNMIYLSTGVTYYTTPVGGNYYKSHTIVESNLGAIPIELGEAQKLILPLGLTKEQASILGATTGNFTVCVSDGSLLKKLSHYVDQAYYMIDSSYGTKGSCMALHIELYPLERGECTLYIYFWNDFVSVDLEVIDPRDIIKLPL